MELFLEFIPIIGINFKKKHELKLIVEIKKKKMESTQNGQGFKEEKLFIKEEEPYL